MELAAANC